MAVAKKNRLREIRKAKGMSGHRVAEMLGVTPGSYYRYERGEQALSEDILERLTKIFHVSTDYILGLSDDPGGHYRSDNVNIKEFLNEPDLKFHWDGIPLGEEELKAAKEVLEYILWKKIRGKSE